jgi:UDP-N-acetylmuramyl pentapeptide phosphotransferase/UDP-N-acetylglucosamine-1-phosphate transferase
VWPSIVAAVVLSASGTWLARRYALGRRLLDEPGERRSHTVPTPRGGGIGPVIAIAVLLVLHDDALPGFDWRWGVPGLVAVAGIGAWDDHRPLGAGIRLLVHGMAGGLMATAFGLWSTPALALLVVAAVAVAVNVWNFMDGIDGIAASQAAIAALAAAWLATGDPRMIAIGIAAAILAFVPFNFPRAWIFLGDAGSGALGYVLVLLAVALAGARPHVADALLLLFPTSAFLVDASLTLARRVLEGEKWWTPHTRHLYQAYARRVGHAPVTVAYAAWSIAGMLLARVLMGRDPALIWMSVLVWYTAAAGLWLALQQRSTRWSAA